MKFTKTLSALAMVLSLSAQAQISTDSDGSGSAPVHYVGTDGNWFNPANWSGGRVPGPGSDVVLDGKDEVVIDAALGVSQVQLRDLTLGGDSRLATLNQAVLVTRNTVLLGNAELFSSASGQAGESLIVAPFSDPQGCTSCRIATNPNPKNQRFVILQSSVTLDVGLGGGEPAALIKTGTGRLELSAGPGYYSTMTADTLTLDGQLRLSLYYGFQPRAGQSFQIFTANQTRSGRFLGLPEGGLVGCDEDGLGFYISYRGGDGNDVVLSTANTSPQSCLLLPAVQKVREAARRSQSATRALGAVVVQPAGLLLPAVQKVREAAAR
jgi:hypothetical protein